MFYDDFYDEPSEFEQMMAEFQESLLMSVKNEYLKKMETLEKENAELREFRDQKDEMERILRNKVAEYDRAIRDAEINAQRKSLKKYFGENLDTAYRPHSYSKMYKKCNRCDDSRHIKYKTPLGRYESEYCVCGGSTHLWSPKEVKLYSFYASSETAERRKPNLYYELADVDRDWDRYDLAADIYNGDPFEKVNQFRVVFFDYGKCKGYCDFLNEKEKEKQRKFIEEFGLELETEQEENDGR